MSIKVNVLYICDWIIFKNNPILIWESFLMDTFQKRSSI